MDAARAYRIEEVDSGCDSRPSNVSHDGATTQRLRCAGMSARWYRTGVEMVVNFVIARRVVSMRREIGACTEGQSGRAVCRQRE